MAPDPTGRAALCSTATEVAAPTAALCGTATEVAFFSPKGMKFHAYWPEGVTNAVFSLEEQEVAVPSAEHMRVCQNDEVRSWEDIHFAPASACTTESIRGSG